jgi:hypothetical protein
MTGLYAVTAAPVRADDLWKALTDGKPDLYLRYRYEHVSDDQTPALRDAHAHTLRTVLGYTTGTFHGFGAYLQLEDVRALDNDGYNNGGSNGVTDRAFVIDPEGTEIQQANLRYRGLPKTTVWVGRQEIEHRPAPLQRYVGTILWRQNWQSFDAARVVNESLPATKIDYAYVWNANRIFGEDNPIPDRSDYEMDSHLLDITYTGFKYGTIEPYVYLLDFNSDVALTRVTSSATFGVRFQGARDLIAHAARIQYTAEFAHQTDYAGNPADLDNNYYLIELGATKTFPNSKLETLTARVSYEVLEGEGPVAIGAANVPNAFQTPLGTNHAFQGWADRFLVTPKDGVEDLFGTLAGRLYGANFTLVYHDYSSNHLSYDYGREWDAMLTYPFKDHYTLGIKYADYNADENPLNLARNAPQNTVIDQQKQAFDLSKFWLWLEIKF